MTPGIVTGLRWVHQSPSRHCDWRPLDGSLPKKGTNSNCTVAKFGIAADGVSALRVYAIEIDKSLGINPENLTFEVIGEYT